MKNFFKFSFLLLVLVSCGSKKVLFTQDIRGRLTSGGVNQVEKIQFYNDKEIRLVYTSTSNSEKISGGKVKFKNGYYYYTVIFPKETPAVVKSIDYKSLKVYFETGEDRYLHFGNYNNAGYYQLGGSKESGRFKVDFEGKSFAVEFGADARLLIKKNQDIKKEEKSRKVRGVKVN